MPISGPVFVTPHAVRQFQNRIYRLDYGAAREAISEGVVEAILACRIKPSSPGHGESITVRARKKWNFRAVIVPPVDGRALPVVVTVLKSGKMRGRK